MTESDNIIHLKNERIHIFEADNRPEMNIRYKGVIDREIKETIRECEGEITFRNISDNPNYRQYHYKGELIEVVSDGSSNFIKHGFGELEDDFEHYSGEWQNDKQNGKGISKRHNGRLLEGEWIDHCFIKGSVTYPDGRIFIGTFNKFQQLKGKGKVIFSNGVIFEGRIKIIGKEGYIYGPAKFQLKDGKIIKKFYLFGDTILGTISKGLRYAFYPIVYPFKKISQLIDKFPRVAFIGYLMLAIIGIFYLGFSL